jgi:hypothetical protein
MGLKAPRLGDNIEYVSGILIFSSLVFVFVPDSVSVAFSVYCNIQFFVTGIFESCT